MFGDDSYAHTTDSKAFCLRQGMFNQGFAKPTPPLVWEHRQTLKIAHFCICPFKSNTPYNMVPVLNRELSDTTFHVLSNPIHRAIGWMARGVFSGQAKPLCNIFK